MGVFCHIALVGGGHGKAGVQGNGGSVGTFAFIQAHDHGVLGVLAGLYGFYHYIAAAGGQQGRGGRIGSQHGGQTVEPHAAAGHLGAEAFRMGLDGVPERVGAYIAALIGPGTALGQRQGHGSALNADAILAVIEDAQPAARLRKVGIAVVAALEHGLLAGIVGSGGALNVAKLDLVSGCFGAQIGGECRFQHTVLFVPVQYGLPFYQRAFGAENHVLLKDCCGAQFIPAVQAELLRAIGGHGLLGKAGGGLQFHHAVGVNIPAIPASGNILCHQQGIHWAVRPLHAVCTGNKGGNAPQLVQLYLQQRGGQRFAVIHKAAGLGGLFTGNKMHHGSAQRGAFQPIHSGGGGAIGKNHILQRYAGLLGYKAGGNLRQVEHIAAGFIQRVQHGITVLRGGKPAAQQFAAGVQHLGHIMQAAVISGGNAAAGQNIVELVYQQGVPQRAQGSAVRRGAGGYGAAGQAELQHAQQVFRHAVVLFDLLLGRQGAAVQLQIQLTVIHGQGGGGSFELLHKGIGRGIFDLGAALQILQASGGFDHLKLRSAAAIAIAKGHQPLRERLLAGNVVLVANALNAFQQPSRVGPGIDHKKVCYHAGTVDAFPDKGFIGEAVGIVPGKLGGQKSGHTKTLHNLWQGGAVAKGIR